jgi:uncharacterized OB-fold protein
MTVNTEAPARPRPDPMEPARPFFEGAAAGKLMVQHCPNCSNYTFYAHYMCPTCQHSLDWVQAAGTGTVYTFTVVYQNSVPYFANKVPYVYAVVQLDEGPRLVTNIEGVDPAKVTCDMPVKATFEDIGDGMAIPIFVPR